MTVEIIIRGVVGSGRGVVKNIIISELIQQGFKVSQVNEFDLLVEKK